MGQIGVIGAAVTTPEEYDIALEVGRLIAGHREILVCGGLDGVMWKLRARVQRNWMGIQ